MRINHCKGLRAPKCPFQWQHSQTHGSIKMWSYSITFWVFLSWIYICLQNQYTLEICSQVIFGIHMVKHFIRTLTRINRHLLPLSQSTGNLNWALVLVAIITWCVFKFKILSVILLVSADSWFILARCLNDNLSNVSLACGRMKTKTVFTPPLKNRSDRISKNKKYILYRDLRDLFIFAQCFFIFSFQMLREVCCDSL